MSMAIAQVSAFLALRYGTQPQRNASQLESSMSMSLHKLQEFGGAEIPLLQLLVLAKMKMRALFTHGNMRSWPVGYQKIGGYLR